MNTEARIAEIARQPVPPLRLAHLSDLHYCARRLEEADACTGAAVAQAKAIGVDAFVVTGDSTDHTLGAHESSIRALAMRLQQMAEHAPVLMLQGTFSHEPPGTLDLLSQVVAGSRICVASRICQIALGSDGRWTTSSGAAFDEHSLPGNARAVFSCVPTLDKGQAAAVMGGDRAAAGMGEISAQALASFTAANALARSRGIATVGMGHGTVHGCLTEHGVPMAGFDHEFTLGAIASAGTRAFMLGHIHAHQAWRLGDGALVAYAGSIGRFHYGEQGVKGWLQWDVDAHDASLTLHPTPASVRLDLEFTAAPDEQAMSQALAERDVRGACVRLRWSMGTEDVARVDMQRLEAMVIAAGAKQVRLDVSVVPAVRARVQGISGAASLSEQLTRWAELVQAPADPLRERLAALQARTVEDIVAAEIGPG